MDAIKSIMLYYDQAGGESVFVMNKQSNRVTKFTANNFWSGRWQDGDLSDLSLGSLKGKRVILNIFPSLDTFRMRHVGAQSSM